MQLKYHIYMDRSHAYILFIPVEDDIAIKLICFVHGLID